MRFMMFVKSARPHNGPPPKPLMDAIGQDAEKVSG